MVNTYVAQSGGCRFECLWGFGFSLQGAYYEVGYCGKKTFLAGLQCTLTSSCAIPYRLLQIKLHFCLLSIMTVLICTSMNYWKLLSTINQQKSFINKMFWISFSVIKIRQPDTSIYSKAITNTSIKILTYSTKD